MPLWKVTLYLSCRLPSGTSFPSLFQAEWLQFSQSSLKGELLYPTNHLGVPSLDSFQQVHVLHVLGTPEVDAVLQMGSHQSGGAELCPSNGWPCLLWFSPGENWLFGCKCILLAHVQPLIHQHLLVPLTGYSWSFHPPAQIITGGCFKSGTAPSLGLIRLHEIPMGPLELVQVSLECLDDILPFKCGNNIFQHGDIYNLLRVHSIPSSMPLNKIIINTNPNTNSWGTPLIWCPSGFWAVDH